MWRGLRKGKVDQRKASPLTDRQKTAAHLSGTVEAHAGEAADVLINLLEPDMDAEVPPPDLVYLQRLLSRRLDRLRTRLVEIDEDHQAELNEDRKLREQRDTAARELKVLVGRLRTLIDSACGSGSCARLLNVEGAIPQDPLVLSRVASRLLEGLRQGFPGEAGHSLLPGVQLDAAAWIDLLQGPLKRLNDALNRLSQENPETIGRQVVKSSLLEEYDRAYRATAKIVQNLFRYVGQVDLAERVRPKQRSPSGGSGSGADVEITVEEQPSTDGDEPTQVQFVPPFTA